MQDGDGVAVLIAAKDIASLVGRAVSSALAQPEAAEVLVFDDGSADDTAAAARAADDGSGRLRVLGSPTNLGPAAARNRLIAQSVSPLICVLDADDLMRAGRLGKLLTGGRDWDLRADDLEFAREGAEDVIIGRLFPDDLVTPRRIDSAEFVRRCMPDPARPRRELAFIKPVIRRDFLQRSGVGYDETLRLGEDFILYGRCLAAGARLELAPACGYLAIERASSLSGAHTTRDLAAFLAADEALARAAAGDAAAHRILRAHVRQLRRNHDFREMLDLRRSGDLAGVLKAMARSPASALHAIRSTVADRLK